MELSDNINMKKAKRIYEVNVKQTRNCDTICFIEKNAAEWLRNILYIY